MHVLDTYGMDTITLAGPLEAKLAAMKAVGFSQVMLSARDVVGHPQGLAAAVEVVRASGLRPMAPSWPRRAALWTIPPLPLPLPMGREPSG